jgi:hypothetical protein
LLALVLVMGVALAIFTFYFLVYRVRHYRVPVGFDSSWYVWRAEYVGEMGIGPLGTNLRPGHALLSAVLGSVSGLSQLQLQVLLPLLLVPCFALALGAFWWSGLESSRRSWLIVVLVGGTLLGTTLLVGENVANLLQLAIVVSALVAVANRIAGGRGFWGAVLLLVAAGVVHWLFLAVFGAVLLLAIGLAVPSSLRRRRAGVSVWQTEAGVLAAVWASVLAVLAVVVGGILRAPFTTFEIREDPRRFIPKLRTDLSSLALPALGPLAGFGAAVLAVVATGPGGLPGREARAHSRRVLAAWTAVALAGLAWGAITLDLPPHRFLMLLVAVPGCLAVASAVVIASRWAGRRAGAAAGVGLAVAAVAALSVPGAIRWYRDGPGVWLDPSAMEQAGTASRYVEALPPGTPVVFVVGPFGPAGLISVPLKERTIRVAIPPDRQEDVHFFVGEPSDLLAGRRSLVVGERTNRATLPYWEDVKAVLPLRPPTLVLEALGATQYREAVEASGATVVGPGVALLIGPPAKAPLPVAPAPASVPRTRSGLVWAGLLLVLLLGAGAGWTRVLLGPGTSPEVLWGLAPTVGAAIMVIAGLLASRASVRLAGPGGVTTYAIVVLTGTALALWEYRTMPPAGQ